MKQLILNFMFFVGAALILVQCAKFFPSSVGSTKAPSKSPTTAGHILPNNPGKTVPFAFTNNQNIRPAFKTWSIGAYLSRPAFPLNVMEYIKGYSLLNNNHSGFYYYDVNGMPSLYNSYINYTYSQLFSKHKNSLEADNQLIKNN